jgi:hypothetical protein
MLRSLKIKTRFQWLVLVLAILLPFLIIRFFPKLQHGSDISTFREWADAWETDWHAIYVNCDNCNYPLLGTYISAGVMSTIDHETVTREINRFRYYLAAVDGLNILALWVILRKLKIENAPLWAGVIGLLPSSWVSSSVWGQIDGAGQFLLLLFFILIVVFSTGQRTERSYWFFLASAALLLSALVLTKQLVYFSMLALGVILLTLIIFHSKKIGRIVFSIIFVSFFVLLPVRMVDASLELPPPFFSHLQYVLATGSQHGSVISSFGLNIWSLFTDDVFSSSFAPLQIGSTVIDSISPYSAGIFLFFLLNVFLLVLFLRGVRACNLNGENSLNRHHLPLFFFYFAMVNAAFNVVLTGTHERYLFHFFPFILVAGLAWKRPSLLISLLISLFAGALCYGAYLYAYLVGMVRYKDPTVIQIATLLHLLLFLYLLIFWIRNPKPGMMNSSDA